MHMADALISPSVGIGMWLASAGLGAYSAKKINEDQNDRTVPLMSVLGAFVFASQMVNFTIPATGSSGHLGGGLLLAILLGPYAGFLTIASVLAIQALFFADGGLLAYGCNVFNLGFFPCFIAYPLIYQPMTGGGSSKIFWPAMLSAIISLQLGAFCVVLETTFSGISDLPFTPFVLLMQPIHLAIGIVEGLVTAAVVALVASARPELLTSAPAIRSLKPVIIGFVAAFLVIGMMISWFASPNPDGLEWSIGKTSELSAGKSAAPESWPAVSKETSISGLVGGLLTLVTAGLTGFLCRLKMVKAR